MIEKVINGRTYRIKPLKFEERSELFEVIGKKLFDTNKNKDLDISKMETSLISTLVSNAVNVICDKDMKPWKNKLLANIRIDEVTLSMNYFDENEEVMEDYYPLLIESARVQISPFLKGWVGRFKDIKESLEVKAKKTTTSKAK